MKDGCRGDGGRGRLDLTSWHFKFDPAMRWFCAFREGMWFRKI
jgi:hypothetical protein